MATANTKLTVDTSQAQGAIQGLQTAWVNAAAGMAVVEKAFQMVARASDAVVQTLRDQGQFFSAVKDDMALAAVQIGTSVTDGMVKPMTLAKGINTLMRGDLKLTQEQFNAVAKASVELGRATGEDVNNVFDRLSKGVLKGSAEAMLEYGMQVKTTGTIQERQAEILSKITQRYGDVSIAAADAGEVMEASANRQKLQMLLIAQQADSLTQALTRYSHFYKTEFAPGIIDTLFGTSLSGTKQIADLMERLQKQTATGDFNRQAKEMATTTEAMGITTAHILGNQAEMIARAEKFAKSRSEEVVMLDKEIAANKQILMLASEMGLPLDNVFQINSRIVEMETRRKNLNEGINAEMGRANDLAAGLVDVYKTQVLPGLETVAKIYGMIWGGKDAGKPAKGTDAKTSAAVKHIETEEEMIARVRAEAAMEARAAEFARMDVDAAARRQKRIDDITQSQAADLKYELDKSAEQDRIMKDREAARVENVKNAELEIKEAKDKAAEEDKKRLESIKAKTIEVSGVVLGAIFAEKKAREGLSRSEYVMKQLAVYMKGQALRYAAEAIGHGAQALAASVLAPATAPALWAASAADAAAAAAFGLGAAAAGKMSGKPSGGSKSESSSKGPQRETLTGTSVQRSEITVILGGRGVVIGNADELARQIGTIMGDAQRRGVVRA